MKHLLLIFLLLSSSIAIAQSSANKYAPAAPRSERYYTASYNKGGNFQVLRYKESGTVSSQVKAGRATSGMALSESRAGLSEQHITLRRDVQMLHF